MVAGDEVIIAVGAAPTKRWFGIFTMVALGGLVLWVAFAGGAPLAWQAAMIAAGLGALWFAVRLHAATAERLVLTRDGLRTESGTLLAAVDDIAKVDRGAFAFRPSNGFLVRLKSRGARGWAPGLWWRVGPYLGVGGVLPQGQARAMAELLTALQAGVLPEDD